MQISFLNKQLNLNLNMKLYFSLDSVIVDTEFE